MAKKGSINWDDLAQGTLCRIHTRSGTQVNIREHVMKFLGRNKTLGGTDWSARPVAGTQQLHDEEIIAIWRLEPDSEKPYMNKMIRPETRIY